MRFTASIAIALISFVEVTSARPQATNMGDVKAVKQLEQTMGDLMVAGNADKLSQIYADDYATVGSDGELVTKKNLLTDFESFHDKLEWFENGPMDVLVLGDVAFVQGCVREKRSLKGKDTSGRFLWQDVLERRDGKWVVWRSAAARVVPADAPDSQSQDPTVVAAIKDFENDLGNAMVARDIEKINRAYGDDWATISSKGEKFTKEGLLEDFKSGNHKLMAFENGPMNVQVLGDVALVQTTVMEKRMQDGKDVSGQFAFMDLLKKRGGQWVIVRSLATRME